MHAHSVGESYIVRPDNVLFIATRAPYHPGAPMRPSAWYVVSILFSRWVFEAVR